MKTKIRQIITLAILLASVYGGCVKAQAIIDTGYYRYTGTPLIHEYWSYAYQVDNEDNCLGHWYAPWIIIDSISMCTKDKLGFNLVYPITTYEIHREFCHHVRNTGMYYWRLPLPCDNMDILGVAMFLDSVRSFHSSYYLKVYVCEKAEDGTHFEKLDSVVLDENTIGVRRNMIHPISRSLGNPETEYDSINHTCYPIPYEDCTLYDTLLQVVEVYFDQPVHIRDSQLFWYIECVSNDSTFYFYWRFQQVNEYYAEGGTGSSFIGYNLDGTRTHINFGCDFMMVITEPLPQWEQSSMELLITDVIEDPDDPEDPEDPTAPESINGVYGNLPISIYPNPTNGVTTITSPEAIKELTVTDLAGRELLHQSSLGSTTTLDTAPLEPGLYLLMVTTASGTATTKLAVR